MTRITTLNSEQFNKICRTCLSNIEGECFISVSKTYLGDKIVKDVLQLCASIQFEQIDNLPQHMCNNCLIKLVNTNAFIQQCQESDSLLKSIVNTQQVSSEIKTDESGIVEIIVATNEYSPHAASLSDEEFVTANDDHIEVENEKPKPMTVKQEEVRRQQFKSSAKHGNRVKKPVNCRTKNWSCSYCSKAFFCRDHLNRHVRTHTKEKPYQCVVCDMRFSMVQNLKRHEKLHTGERPHKCDICGKGFIQRASLRNHKKASNDGCGFSENTDYCKNKQGEKSTIRLRCEQCGKMFKRFRPFNLHLKRHLPLQEDQPKSEEKTKDESKDDARMYVCDVCKKGYKSKSTLKAHQLTHGEKKFLCSECGKGFVTKSSLESHQKVHTKEKPYTCSICNKSFAYTGSFDMHMLVHTREKKYVCKICSKSFTQGTHLKYHLRIHSGERPYSCDFCGKSFAVKGNLTVHVRTHTGETPFTCPVCGKGFYDSSSMKKHRRSHGEVTGGGDVETQQRDENNQQQLT